MASALQGLMSALPTPARPADRHVRPRTEGNGKHEKAERRALRKALADIRRINSVVEDSFIISAGDREAESLKNAMVLYNQKKPEKKKGEKGVPHPLGPARWAIFLTWIEGSLNRYKDRPESCVKIGTALKNVEDMHKAIQNLTAKIGSGTVQLGYLERIVRYCETRTTKDGRQIIHIALRDTILTDEDSDALALLGLGTKYLYAFLAYPFQTELCTGPAPASSEERELLKMLQDK